jgi:hypothetical protein
MHLWKNAVISDEDELNPTVDKMRKECRMNYWREKQLKSFFFSPWLYSPWMTLAAPHIGGFLSYLDIW